MILCAKKIPIETGEKNIVILNIQDSTALDLHYSDRVTIKRGSREIIASIDITKSSGVVKRGEIGIFHEISRLLDLKNGDRLFVNVAKKPESIKFIKKKLNGSRLNYKETKTIVEDIINDRLTGTEMAYYVAANFIYKMTEKEIIDLTRAMVNTGSRLKLNKRIVIDKHCIGGVAGNRTTMIVVPILASTGLVVPKTSSRAITSAAGTSDTVEVLCDVSFSISDMKRIIDKTNACLIWGGAVNLAPADDKVIRVEMPLAIDPIGQLLASILAKKLSVSATHCLIDIPAGRGCKTATLSKAKSLKREFERVSKKLGLKVKVIITDGTEPIGNGIGPNLEARDVLYTLLDDMDNGSVMLKEKSITLAGLILDLSGKTRKGEGKILARELLESKRAYGKFIEIIKAQNAKVTRPEEIKLARYVSLFTAKRKGKIMHIDNKMMNKVARIAGAPHDKAAGIYLYIHKGYDVKKGSPLCSVYSESKARLEEAIGILHKENCIEY